MRTLIPASPHMHGPDVREAQNLLAHNRFGDFYPGKIDGDYGETSAAATRRCKYLLGYAKVNGAFGPALHAYLSGTKLPPKMLARRKARLAEDKKRNTVKARALKIAEGEAAKHITESPMGSNLQPYGAWYGFNGVPWCAEFVSYCFAHAGDKHGLKTALAFQWEWWARAKSHGLSLTGDPEPGDIVVYHHNQGHTGIFRRWTNRSRGEFEAVEGNTSNGGSQDNGGAVLIQKRDTGWVPTVFVRVGK